MNEIVLKAWEEKNYLLKKWISDSELEEIEYDLLFKKSIEILFNDSSFFDLNKIQKIDWGDYQGTIIYIIAQDSYQPSTNETWFTSVGYGSCSGCDTLQDIFNYESGKPSDSQVDQIHDLCLHMMQKMKKLSE